MQYAAWAGAILDNGLGRYEEALAAAEPASEDSRRSSVAPGRCRSWSRRRPQRPDRARRRRAGPARRGHDGGRHRLGAGHRGPLTGAARHGRARRARAIGRPSIGSAARRIRPELARAHLLYGEWLRREGRRIQAREQLRAAYELFVGIGMEAFAERARRELLATGEKVRKRTVETRDELTAQEQQIAALARDGLSNPEIGARLFISPRTVEWHLRKVFDKLGITSRKALPDVLPGPSDREESIA